jgi:hypothetical protein
MRWDQGFRTHFQQFSKSADKSVDYRLSHQSASRKLVNHSVSLDYPVVHTVSWLESQPAYSPPNVLHSLEVDRYIYNTPCMNVLLNYT